MKRSRAITLTMLAGTVVVLSGCNEDEKPRFVKDEKECAEQLGDEEGCLKAAEQARQDHEKTAPRYGSQKDCEEQFGPDRCRKSEHDGASWFVPAMTGFMIGRMMDGNQYRVQPACANGGQLYANGCGPVRAGSGFFYYPRAYTYAGRYSGSSYEPAPAYTGAWTEGKVAASRASMGSAAIARGGFGGSAVGEAGE